MNKPQSGQSASASRRLRRSLTEITMPTTSSAALQKPAPAQPIPTVPPRLAMWRDEKSRPKVAPKVAVRRKSKHAAEASDLAPSSIPQAKSLAGARSNADNVLQAFEDVSSAAAKTAKDYQSWMFELMTANVTATLEYAQRLSDVKSPAGFVELSTSHARKQVDLALTHTAAFRELSQSSALTNAERLNAGVAKVLTQEK